MDRAKPSWIIAYRFRNQTCSGLRVKCIGAEGTKDADLRATKWTDEMKLFDRTNKAKWYGGSNHTLCTVLVH